MAKKRKNVEKIIVDEEPRPEVVEGKPDCYGEKQPYCKPELCGEYFETCEVKDGHSNG